MPSPDIERKRKTVWVGNLSFGVTRDMLQKEFDKYGAISSLELPVFRDSGKIRGYAFIEYDREEDADYAIKKADGIQIDGREVQVQLSGKPPRRRSPPRGRYEPYNNRGGGGGGGGGRDYRDRDYDRGRDYRDRDRDYGDRDRYRDRDYNDRDRHRDRDRDYGGDRERDRDRDYGRNRSPRRETRDSHHNGEGGGRSHHRDRSPPH